jgi:betaine-aldehyde dehydrogenase
VEAAFFNAGQDCTAATRVLVDAAVHDELVAKLVAHTRDHAKTGAPDDPEAFFGPVNNADQLARVQGSSTPRARSRSAGAARRHRLLLRGDDRHGRLPGRRGRAEEIFGPCSRCSRSRRKRTRSRWRTGCRTPSRHPSGRASTRALRFSRDLDFGCVWINAHIPFVSDMPHGGFKHSGYGKDLSVYGFEDYTASST